MLLIKWEMSKHPNQIYTTNIYVPIKISHKMCFLLGSVGSMPLQFLEIGFHVEIHAIEWHDFEHETQFHGVVVA